MNLDLDTAAAEWLAAKAAEADAVKRRRKMEDHILSLLGVPATLEGTANAETDGGHKIKLVGRLNRKVNPDLVQEIAAENGLEEHLSNLFRWKPEINAAAWKAASSSVTATLAGAITTTPGRPSFAIEKDD